MTQPQAARISRKLAELIYVVEMAQSKSDWEQEIEELAKALIEAFPEKKP